MEPKKYTITEAICLRCDGCKYYYQKKNHMSCANKQSQFYNKYVYWVYVCDHHEAGKQLDQKELKDLGYVQKTNTLNYANGTSEEYFYYENK